MSKRADLSTSDFTRLESGARFVVQKPIPYRKPRKPLGFLVSLVRGFFGCAVLIVLGFALVHWLRNPL